MDYAELVQKAAEQIEQADSSAQLNEVRVEWLGRKGRISVLSKNMGAIAPEDRPAYGRAVNEARAEVERRLSERAGVLKEAEERARLEKERVDVTLPGPDRPLGARHPLMQVYHEIRDVFVAMGFDVVDGPEVELDEYNFERLNIPKEHPARDAQDTFYISRDVVLRTHTSPTQVRTMLQQKPPIRMIAPGRVYRFDEVDATHSPVFMQLEGLVVDRGIRFSDLKGILNDFLRSYYGEHVKTKFRPGFFPFTEPSAEVDVTCSVCGGKGCSACGDTGMIEVLGCGTVNPIVLENCGIDSSEYTGFAFGIGVDRLTLTKYGMSDIRTLYENDVRFLQQFR